MNTLKLFTIILCTIISTSALKAESVILPFDVEIDGQTAEIAHENALFGTIKLPVAADAKLTAKIETQMLIINVFPCDGKGIPTAGAAPAIIMAQGSNETTLANTMDKKALKPGTYIANIVASGKTSRVFFTVK